MNKYKEKEGPWGHENDTQIIEVRKTETLATTPLRESKNWFHKSFGLSGMLNRSEYIITLILPMIIFIPFTVITARYFMENSEILQQKLSEIGFFPSISYLINQMVSSFSPLKLWTYNIFAMLQYVAYWILMAATVKRLKDSGISGFSPWIFSILGIAFIWPITIIIALCLSSKPHS